MLSRDDVAPQTACFLAQQSAEKALKAILVLEGLNVIRTHDLDALSEKLPEKYYKEFEIFDLTWLTEWSVESCYPGDWPEASCEDAKKAVTIATEDYQQRPIEITKQGLKNYNKGIAIKFLRDNTFLLFNGQVNGKMCYNELSSISRNKIIYIAGGLI